MARIQRELELALLEERVPKAEDALNFRCRLAVSESAARVAEASSGTSKKCNARETHTHTHTLTRIRIRIRTRLF